MHVGAGSREGLGFRAKGKCNSFGEGKQGESRVSGEGKMQLLRPEEAGKV